jgi:hypothetical protein
VNKRNAGSTTARAVVAAKPLSGFTNPRASADPQNVSHLEEDQALDLLSN